MSPEHIVGAHEPFVELMDLNFEDKLEMVFYKGTKKIFTN